MKMETKYYMFILGRLISTFGNWFAAISVPFLIYDITGSAMAVSMSFLLETFPIILLSPVISFLIDQFSRKIILQLCELVSALSITACIITNCDNVYIIYLMCVMLSITTFVYNTAVNSYIPDICGKMEVKKANTMDSFASNLSMVFAPIIAGECIRIWGYNEALRIDMITFIISMIFLQFLNKDIRESTENDKEKIEKNLLIGEFKRIIKKDSFLKVLILICIMFSVCGAIFSSLDAVYIAEIFNGSSKIYGYINAAWGVGMLIASGLYIFYKNISEVTMFSIGILTMGVSTIGYGISGNIVVCILFNFFGGIANTLYVIYYKSLIQSRTTSHNRGKVFTIQSLLSKLVSMVIVFFAGGLADILTVRFSIVTSGIFTIILALFCFKVLKIA